MSNFLNQKIPKVKGRLVRLSKEPPFSWNLHIKNWQEFDVIAGKITQNDRHTCFSVQIKFSPLQKIPELQGLFRQLTGNKISALLEENFFDMSWSDQLDVLNYWEDLKSPPKFRDRNSARHFLLCLFGVHVVYAEAALQKKRSLESTEIPF